MSAARRLWPLLTGTQRYEKVVSTRRRGHGVYIVAPILAYLIETPNGRVLYDVGCDYRKIADPALRSALLEPMRPLFEPPEMSAEQRIPAWLRRLGLTPRDVDVVFLGHLHFDHAGGLGDLPGCEVHVHAAELAAARSGTAAGVFDDELANAADWHVVHDEYTLCEGVHAISTPGHTAGHMSMLVELTKGPPVLLCGDAADLEENLVDDVAPGYCWQDDEAEALASIRKLKNLAALTGAELWPNHDFAFFHRQPVFPRARE